MVDTHDDILELMVEVADRVIRPRFRALSGNDIDEKSPGDYVTVADRESEKLLTAALLARNPGCLVVGEEASYADPSIREGLGVADLAYTVDPVDGTGNFVKGSPDYAVMIAEIAVVCAIGLGWSSLVNRTAGSTVLTYLTVAVITLLTPIAMEKGLRFAIREGGRTVGAGVVEDIIE